MPEPSVRVFPVSELREGMRGTAKSVFRGSVPEEFGVEILGVIPNWGYSSGWGYGPSGIVGTIVVIVLILLLLGKL